MFTTNNKRHGSLAYAEELPYGPLAEIAPCVDRANLPYVVIGQFSAVISCAFLLLSSLIEGVFYVVTLRTRKQVSRVYTTLVGQVMQRVKLIAAMTGEQFLRQRAVDKFVREPMRLDLLSVKPESAIAVVKAGRSPKPAAIRCGLVNFCKESFGGRFVCYDWLSHSVRVSLTSFTSGLIRPAQGLVALSGPSYFTAGCGYVEG